MRIKVVVQRYGRDLLGGAETHAALIAGILARHHDVEVLTTTAGDYQRWSESYSPGPSHENGVSIYRFPVERGRDASWPLMHDLLHQGFEASRFARLPAASRSAFAARVRDWPDALQEQFIRAQGPISPQLHARLRRDDYDRALFVTYLYPTTYDGLLAVPRGKASVVPTLHDEPPAYLPLFGRRLSRARLLCSTDAEVALLPRLYPGVAIDARRIGYGIEIPPDERNGSAGERDFLLYAGRVDTQKGVPDLLEWYAALREAMPSAPRLVLVGEVLMALPRLPGVEARGFVSDAEKLALMRRALALVHPSPYESLGIVLLEAMACRTPILVNAASDVMVEHCRRAQAGLWVRDRAEFAAAVQLLASRPALRDSLGANGRAHVESEYTLDAYEDRLGRAFSPEPG